MQHQQKILDILKKPYQLDEQTLPVLQKLTAEYPYCQSLQILLAKNLQTFDKLDFEKQVNKASAYAIDRRKFQRYISDRDKPVDIKEQIARIHEGDKSAEPPQQETASVSIVPAALEVPPREVIMQDPAVEVPEKLPPGAPIELPQELPGDLPPDVPQPAPSEVPTQLPQEAPGTFPADVPPGKAGETNEPTQVSKPAETLKAEAEQVTTPKADPRVMSPVSMPSATHSKTPRPGFFERLLKRLNLIQADSSKQPSANHGVKPAPGGMPSKKEVIEVAQVIPAKPPQAAATDQVTIPAPPHSQAPVKKKQQTNHREPLINRGFTEYEKLAQKPDINLLIEKFLKEEPRIQIKREALPERQEDLSEASTHEDPQLVSETLAQIFHKQGNKDKALEIYEKLCLKFPEKSSYFAKKIIDIKNEFNT